ncbi:hypothetical protein M8C21_021015 [Ambrosia artemisiifolia]|uniref:Uncharacterized protein n=1 Tax=Ambrosia artemisiifolia TaxID=4212 RepID=A0AAD5BKA2_AMBAR|nr:hypothetical protein M8C21_021015 [Ambrosia artemisiifolia]
MFELHKCSSSSIEWKPSPIVALATSLDDSHVATAREDASLEIWLVSAASVGWHCQLRIEGDGNMRVSSLVWCGSGRLFSSCIDGSVLEWDLFNLTQKNAFGCCIFILIKVMEVSSLDACCYDGLPMDLSFKPLWI